MRRNTPSDNSRQLAAAALAAKSRAGDRSGGAAPPAALRPPSARRQRVAPANTPDRFDKEVLGGRLWHPACQAAAKDITEQIPLSFSSLDDYVCTFEPLVLEEAREGLRADWAEGCAAGGTWAVEVVSVEELADGWCTVRVRPQGGDPADLKRACQPNWVVVLSQGQPPARGAVEWAAAQAAGGGGGARRAAKRPRLDAATPAAAAQAASEGEEPAASVDSSGGGGEGEAAEGAASAGPASRGGTPPPGCQMAAGLVQRSKERDVFIKLHPACAAHARDHGAPCWAVLAALRASAAAGGGAARRWWLTRGKLLVSNQREFDAVHGVRAVEKGLLRYLLRPQLLAPLGAHYDAPEVRRGMWPEQARQPEFIRYLRERYDMTQLEAIEMAACHLGAPEAADGAAAHPPLPFVLIQGPPGTGKTHTVKGMLNVWHLVAYQHYYDGLCAATAPAPSAAAAAAGPAARRAQPLPLNEAGSNVVDWLASEMLSHLGQAVAQTKPRLLVCTPSNAACDELLTRVMREGFCDGAGRTYRPNVVRVGSEQGGVGAEVRERLVGLMVNRYRLMTQQDWHRRTTELRQRHTHLSRELEALELSLTRAAAAAAAAPGDAVAAQQHGELAKKLVDRAQAAARYRGELERLEVAREFIWGRPGAPHAEQEFRLREAEQSIEASFLSEAEMVFTTLSSTQRVVFRQSAAKAPFHTVLIDEAGQASEVAALQPLVFGAKRVVLVGDPQQLPATILSELARGVQMERSLFERLQMQGAPVKMLSVQYRMHPEIRQFPSAHFYGGRLLDAPSITAMPRAPFYDHPLLKAYVLFDVAKGKEQRREGGGSLSNREEALLAACLFSELRSFLIERAQNQPGSVTEPTTVGVITPYREQRALLRRTFEEVCGKGPAAEVFIETVDSFQGKQLDVVILSCVRAAGGAGLGFVTDVRRMNVAITRAKRALWVLGSRATLRANREWDALISDAEQRGVVIADAEARDLFPNLPYWQQEQAQQAPAAVAAQQAGPSRPPSREPTPAAGPAPTAAQHRQVAAALAAVPLPQPVHPQAPPPRPMVSYQELRKQVVAAAPQQQQQGPAGAAPPNGPMQRQAPKAAQQPAAGAGQPAPAAAVRPMQRAGGGKRPAYPAPPTRR